MGTVNNEDKLKRQEAEIKKLKNKVKSLSRSNESYKAKNKKLREAARNKDKEAGKERHKQGGICPKGHGYNTGIIKTSIEMKTEKGLSYRQTAEVMKHLIKKVTGEEVDLSGVTIREWVLKQSCYELETPKTWLNSPAVIIDETAGMGQEKGLCVLGVDIEKWKAEGGSLRFQDVQILSLQSKNTWKSEDISEVLKEVEKKIEKPIKYVVSDKGASIIKGAKIKGVKHVADCSHYMANCVERYYSKAEWFISFQKEVGQLRQKLVNGKHSSMMLPSIRTKGRYMNLFAITKWLKKSYKYWQAFNEEQKALLYFIQEKKCFLEELITMVDLIREISKHLKCNGLNNISLSLIEKEFDKVLNKTKNIVQFQKDMQEYGQKILDTLPEESPILCCSDIIESIFGRLKYRNNKANMQGFSMDFLSTVLFCGKLDKHKVLKAMESFPFRRVKSFFKQNMVPSFSQIRCDFWANLGTSFF